MNKNFKAGFVAIVGKPNVGKSTLMNLVMGEKISIISPKPQTTRHQIKGIFTDDERQIVFLDTPGFLKARYELHNRMLEYLQNAIRDADVILFITDAHHFPTDYDEQLLAFISKFKKSKIALLNKIDLVDETTKDHKIDELEEYKFDKIIACCLTDKPDIDSLLGEITNYLPYSPPFYSADEISDLPMRFFVQEIIREQIFLNFRDELPYATSVSVEEYKDLPNKVEIKANLWLERKSQKPIIIGKNGEMIKRIRMASEKEIYNILKKRVKLTLWVKIKPNWRKKKNALKEFGYR
ncbi:MAG: GTPase Era [Candidatus Cloacimonetes bacterium]|nr:GTPase Era [Candidatus Cloacimonadota bacterium]MCF7813656.1 GTPase Era [Candidatus Cloacimonadota bacterium]MCF7869146.1 GTPase Era [Candidatus Cloacimonadota bacterium]MCF7882492.1 GTPase Era [Candidatus Cloacimonadota bacterium]